MITVMIGTAFVLAAFFPIYALLRADWKANAASRSMFAFSCVVAGVLGLAFFRRSGYSPPQWVGGLAYVLIIGTLLGLDVVLVRVQRRQRRRIASEQEKENV